MASGLFQSAAFGLRWHSDIALPGFDPSPVFPSDAIVPVVVRRIDRLPDRPYGRPVGRGAVHDDGIRFAWENEVVFDMIDGVRIDYRPGPSWTGVMPACFYGTVAALTLAWRGIVPFHACAVELDGAAVMIAGVAGAGKSTLTAGLLGAGALFVADDLVAASSGRDGGVVVALGRPTIRLHPATAAAVETLAAEPVLGDARGKWLARPRRRSVSERLDLTATLVLDGPDRVSHGVRLFEHLFRRCWLDMLPMRTALIQEALTIATRVPVMTCPPIAETSDAARRLSAESVVGLIRDTRAKWSAGI